MSLSPSAVLFDKSPIKTVQCANVALGQGAFIDLLWRREAGGIFMFAVAGIKVINAVVERLNAKAEK